MHGLIVPLLIIIAIAVTGITFRDIAAGFSALVGLVFILIAGGFGILVLYSLVAAYPDIVKAIAAVAIGLPLLACPCLFLYGVFCAICEAISDTLYAPPDNRWSWKKELSLPNILSRRSIPSESGEAPAR